MKKLAALLIAVVVIVSTVLYAAGQQDEKKEAPAAEAPAAKEEAKPAPADPEKVIVTINGEKIREKQVAAEVDKRLEAQKKMMPPGMEVAPERWDMMRQQIRGNVAQMLVDITLIEQAVKKKDIKVTEEEVNARIDEMAEGSQLTREQVLEQAAAQYGMTEQDIKDQIRTRLQIEALIDAEMKDAEVTEADAKAFYEENIERFKQPEQVRAAHILISPETEEGATEEQKAAAMAEAKKQAEEVLAKAKAGEDFAALAKEYSDDPGSKDTGGEYTFGRGRMVPEFEATAFSLEPGQISDLVETQYGYHIIKLYEKQEAKTQSFDEVKDRLVEYLEGQKKQQFWTDYMTRVKDEAKIEWAEGEEPAPRPMMPGRPGAAQPQPQPQPQQAQPQPQPKAQPEGESK